MKRGTTGLRKLFSRKNRNAKVTANIDEQERFVKKFKKSKKKRQLKRSSKGRRNYELKGNGKRAGIDFYCGSSSGPRAQNQQAIYTPQRKKFKGFQRDDKGNKVR